MLILFIAGALAQAAPTTWPAVDAQRVGPAVDSPWTSLTSTPTMPPAAAVSIQASYLDQPLTWTPPAGESPADLVGGVLRFDLQASHGWGPIRLALSAPLVVRTHSSLLAAPRGLAGDPAVDLKWLVWGAPTQHHTSTTLALHGGVRFPAGASAEQMGLGGPAGRLGLLGAITRKTGWGVLLDTAYRLEPSVQLGPVASDDSLDVRAALLFPTLGRLHPSVEAALLFPVPDFSEPSLANREVVANIGRKLSDEALIRAHGGLGIGGGIGTPAWRMGLSLGIGLSAPDEAI